MAYTASATTTLSALSGSFPLMPHYPGPPAIQSVAQTRILHLSGFSRNLKTRDVYTIFAEWEDERSGFRIKWIDDESCYIIFADALTAKRAFLSVLCNMPTSLIHDPLEPSRPVAQLRAYAGEDVPNIIASIQQRSRARSNAGSLSAHGRRPSLPNGASSGRRESIGDDVAIEIPSGSKTTREENDGRRMTAASTGRPFAQVATNVVPGSAASDSAAGSSSEDAL